MMAASRSNGDRRWRRCRCACVHPRTAEIGEVTVDILWSGKNNRGTETRRRGEEMNGEFFLRKA